MSRSYRNKYRNFFACGRNTEFYRDRRRNIRAKHRHVLRNTLSKYNIDEIDEQLCFPRFPKEDQWSEPTDGHYVMTRDQVKHMIIHDDPQYYNYWMKILRTLKSKKFKH